MLLKQLEQDRYIVNFGYLELISTDLSVEKKSNQRYGNKYGATNVIIMAISSSEVHI